MIDPGTVNQLTPQQRAALECELLGVRPVLLGFALRLARNRPDADDLVQTTMLKALGAFERFQPGTSMKRWTCTIMKNAFVSGYHRNQREPNVDDEALAMNVQIAPAQEWAIRSREMRVALDHLSPVNREALLGVAMGDTYDDVAERCGCELGTVKSRVSRARHSLTVKLGNLSNEEAYSACL